MFFTDEINKIALSWDYDKRMQLIDSIETYAYGRSKDLVSEKKWLTSMMLQKELKKTSKLSKNSWTSIQNINDQRLWIRKNKFII